LQLILDTNVIVSAVLNRTGAPRQLFDRWRADDAYELVVSPQLLEEIADVVSRPKLARLVAPAEADALIATLRSRARTEPDPVDRPTTVRDPKDDYLIALALQAEATAIVSGDHDLVELEDPPIPIWTVTEALDQLG
jgi:uncharacterized protein